jgi:hypothetical protein
MNFSAHGLPIGLTAQIANLAALFSAAAPLRIPAYQRPYTWTSGEVAALLVDLLSAFERRAAYYFIGHIVLVKTERGELEVADGQQRLATFTMLLAWVRDRLSARSGPLQDLIVFDDAARPRLRLRKADERFFLEYVQVPGGLTRLLSGGENWSDSQSLIAQAVETIEDNLSGLDDETLDAFIRFVVRSATFDVMIADERGGAATIFATMNNRGRSLSGPDILKQELLERSGLDDAGVDEAALLWEGLEDRLGRNAFSQLVSEIIPVIYTGELLRGPGDLTALRIAIQSRAAPRQFLTDDLPRYGAALLELRAASVKAGVHSREVNRRVKRLMTLSDTLWLPAAVAYLADHRGSSARTLRFFKGLEALALASFLNAVRADRKERRFARILKALGDDAKLFGPSNLALSPTEHDELLGRINKQPSRETGQRRVVVLWVNAALPDGEVLALEDDATVEHVLPANPSPDWVKRFPVKEVRRELCNLLGNFVLLSALKNDRAGNKSFDEKKREYFAADGDPIYALTRDIARVEDWTADVIRARHERLVQALAEDLGLI